MIDSLKSVIHFDKRKAIVGAVMAVLVLLVYCIWFSWYTGVIFAVLFGLVGCFKLDIKQTKWQYLINILGGICVALATCLVGHTVVNLPNLFSLHFGRLLLNILCVFIMYGVIFLITANWKASVLAASFALVILCTANGFICQFRGRELGPMDIFSVGTAMSVVDQYNLSVTARMTYGWTMWALFALAQFVLPQFPVFTKKRMRFITLGAMGVFIFTLIFASVNIPIRTWYTQGTQYNGYFLNFFIGIRDSFVKKPKNYNPETVEAFAQKYPDEVEEEKQKHPNIIVIMDESYADFRILGGGLNTNQPVTPFLDSLTENTIKGYALSSVYGGNTANSEFEFLTGHSMGFLPSGSVPYQQYIKGDTYTFAWLMNSYGYKTMSTHPYWSSGWCRKQIYPYFGFQESTFIDDYPNENFIRSYISDQEMFEYIMNRFEEKEHGKPLFLFGITMQNHGGYDFAGENYTQNIELEGYSREYPLAEQYLSVIHETDKAVEYLLRELEDYPEDTVVLFFGDHFPKVEAEFYEELYGGSFDTLSEQMLQYTIPFFIWANYDIQEENVDLTSINYLPRRLLDVAGLELSPYYQFLAKMENVVPAMNGFGYYSVSKNEFISYDDAADEEKAMLNEYEILQYNNLFDSENRNEIFYEQYIHHENNKPLAAVNG